MGNGSCIHQVGVVYGESRLKSVLDFFSVSLKVLSILNRPMSGVVVVLVPG